MLNKLKKCKLAGINSPNKFSSNSMNSMKVASLKPLSTFKSILQICAPYKVSNSAPEYPERNQH